MKTTRHIKKAHGHRKRMATSHRTRLAARRRLKKRALLGACILMASGIMASWAVFAADHTSAGRPALPALAPDKAVHQQQPAASPPYIAREFRDVAYAHGQLLDIFQPRKKVHAKAPLVLYIHGGGWEKNDKASEPDQLALLEPLRDKGFAVASINYRLLPGAVFPEPLQDSLAAVRFLRSQADVYGLDPNKFALYGFSAGGTLAALTATLDSNNEFASGGVSSRVQAVVTLAGVFDFSHNIRPASQARMARLLQAHAPGQIQPATYVSPDDPPFLLLHGVADQYVPVAQDTAFAQLLRKAGITVQQLNVEYGDHGLNPMGGILKPGRPEVGRVIERFLHTELQL